MPSGVRQMLAEAGKLDTDGLARTARLRSCRRCGGRVVVGLDNDPCGLPVRADPTHLPPLAEAVALLQGRATYDLLGRPPAGPHLQHRTPERITGTSSAGPGRGPAVHAVLADHRCRDGPGPGLRIDPNVLTAFTPASSIHQPEEAPF